MNTRRVRASGPPPCASSGCNAPQSECLGVCHQINTHCMTKPVAAVMPEELPVQMHEPEPVRRVVFKVRQFYRNLPFGKPKVKA